MPNEVRFGIVGLGMGRARADICVKTPGAKLVAVCDSWEERGRKAEQELGAVWTPNYEDLLSRDDIDVIGVFTPSGTHGELATKALSAGKHVFMTKPMDIRLSACDQAIKAAEANKKLLAVDFESRYLPVNHQIRNCVQSGALGNMVLGDVRVKWYRGQDYYSGWRASTLTEAGSLANQAVHYLDLLMWWYGPVASVLGKKGTLGHNIEVEDTTASVLTFKSGAFGVVMTTTCSVPELGTFIELTGSKGTMSWKDQQITFFKAVKEGVAEKKDEAGYILPEHRAAPELHDLSPDQFDYPKDLPANIFADFVAALTEGKPLQCDGYEGRKTIEVIDAVYQSSETGKAVLLG